VNRTLAQGIFIIIRSAIGRGGNRKSGAPSRKEVLLVDALLIRFLFVLIVGVIGFLLRPFNLRNLCRVVGLLLGVAIVVFEWRLRAMSLKRLIGAAIAACWAFLALIFSPSSSAAASRPAHPKFPADHGHADHGLRGIGRGR